MPSYYGEWRRRSYSCRGCEWSGPGEALRAGEVHREWLELDCPRCGETITSVSYPTLEQSRENWDRLSADERAAVELAESRRRALASSRLERPEQLPELPGEELVMTWDFDPDQGGETVISCGEQEVWREPSVYEGYERYLEVVEILCERYGSRLRDVVPTPASEVHLYGDVLAAWSIVAARRARFGSQDDGAD